MYTYLIVGIILLVALIAVAIPLLNRVRSLAIQNDLLPDDELAEFQRMREEGTISEEEYRRLKKIVADKTVEKLKNE